MSEFDLQGIGMTSQRTRVRLVERLKGQGIEDNNVLEAIKTVPRHIFVDEALSHRAYEDSSLPIGFGQTISQPFVVALMTQALFAGERAAGEKVQRVLEIGTGSGYQTAVLSKLVRRVYSVERIKGLIDRAKDRLAALSMRNVLIKYDDGTVGWPQQGPFDAIIVTAAPEQVPQELLDQLDDGGRLVVPVGGGDVQELRVIERQGEKFEETILEYVRFVPLLRGMQPT